MTKLTQKQLEALTPDDDNKTFREDNGLVAKVRVGVKGVTVLFRYEYKFEGRKRDIRLGSWPKLALAHIRKERDQAMNLVKSNIDPATAKKASKYEAQRLLENEIATHSIKTPEDLTFDDLFKEWLEHGVARQDNNAALKRSFLKDVLPPLKDVRIRHLTDLDITKVLKAAKARGLNRTVVVLNNDIAQMLRWAEKRKPWRALLSDGNPCELVNLKMILDKDYREERDRTLTDEEISELHQRIKNMVETYAALPAGQKYTGSRPLDAKSTCAIWICLGTLCRIGELLQSKWAHIDFEKRIWHIPAENTKAHAGRSQDHTVYLSDFVLGQFKELKQLTGDCEYAFPSKDKQTHVCLKTVSKQIGDRQIKYKNRSGPMSNRTHDDSLVLTNGEEREWTPHDLRRTGATIMQRLGIPLDIIDRCQNHVLQGSKVRRHYLHYDYAKEKAEAWELLGKHIEICRNNPVR
ncbi:tyrosine-type recombinase/integrase [Thalassolituus sp. LLYu03]|uniref:tyrosine-type recombinase/integrase n=1 Tax=Thalassolituus sp. LLYu03 TaxID=3421656 RepID=UPI003D29B336